MAEELTLVDPLSSNEWMQFIDRHPDASIFHHPAWIRVISQTYGFPTYAACLKHGERICAGIPFAQVQSAITGNRCVAFPFSDYCAPLVQHNDPTTVERLISFSGCSISRPSPRIEIHAPVSDLRQSHFERNFVRHTLDISRDPQMLFASFDRRTTQRSIRIAEKKGVIVRECRTKEEFDLFYGLHLKTRRRLGVPVQPQALFDAIWNQMMSAGLGFALIAFHNDTPLAGGVFFAYKNTVVFKYSASDMRHKYFQPTHAFIWTAMQIARERGNTILDFGRTEKSHSQLRRFKKTWGAEEREMDYTIIADHPRPQRLSKFQGILGTIIRHSPEFVCRVSGEVLYRHFA